MMKKLVCFICTAAALAASAAQASTLNEWNFYSDPAGKTLSAALNSEGSAVFSAGGSGFLETDGQGGLLCTHVDSGTTGMWTNGAVLDAATAGSLTAGVFFLRYDFEYNLDSTNNNSGTLLGLAFTDVSGTKVAGVALEYDVGASVAPTNLTVTEIQNFGADYAGNISVITKVDLSAQKLSVWYDLSGTGSFSAETNPQASNITVNLPSIGQLRLQATGDFRPAGSDNSATVGLIRMTDNFADAAASELVAPPAKYSNEWNFERDVNGQSLSEAINSGTNNPLAQFSAGFASTVFTTNRALFCTGNDAGTNGVWTNGAVMNAALPTATSGVHYLRYDVAYDLSSTNNNSGTVLGVYFTGGSGDKVAGLVLGYDRGNLANAVPTNRTLTSVTNGLPLSGTLAAIAEVNLDTSVLKVWYDLSGSNTFNTNTPAFSTNISLTTITNLRFHATGDFQPAGSTNYAAVDNIRHTASLSEIIAPPEDLEAPPVLSVATVSNSQNGLMETGETNLVTVVISNSGGPVADVTSALIHNGTSGAFSIVSNNAPVALGAGTSVTNTYTLIANTNGSYTFTVQALSAETNSASTDFSVVVGSHLKYLTNHVVEISGGIFSNRYEPGETISITVVSTNDGARNVSNIVNTLSADLPSYFAISPSSAVYPLLAAGGSTSTVYTVAINSTTPAGTYTFSVTNRSGSMIWADSFTLDVYFEALPSVTNQLVINVIQGTSSNKVLTLQNTGNAPVTFALSDDGTRPVTSYTDTLIPESLEIFNPVYDEPDPSTTFTNWSGNSTAPMAIGFSFPLAGTVYTNFSVSAYGAVVFGGNTVGANSIGSLPSGTSPVAAPFWSSTAGHTNTIRYKKESDRLVVSWNNGTAGEFQAWLYPDGQILYLYAQGVVSGDAAVGVQDAAGYQNISYLPPYGNGLLLTPSSWITYAPTNGTVAGLGSSNIIFTANATNRSVGTTTFTNYVTWGNGTTDAIAVTVNVLSPSLGLTVTPSPVTFYGPAGWITDTTVSLINTGNVALAYTVTDTGAQAAGYTWTNIVYSWQEALNLDANQFGKIPLEFPFPFHGNTYTQFVIYVNGTIGLVASGQTNGFAAPYQGDMILDANARILYSGNANQMVVTWENMAQTGGDDDLTFQAVLNRDGSILFQYKMLGNASVWSSTAIGLHTATNWIRQASLSNQWTTVTTTNYTTTTSNLYDTVIVVTNSTNVVVNYTNTVTEQAIRFTPSGRIIISASPVSGTVPVGGTNILTLTGDARSLTSTNGGYSVTNSTTFRVAHTGGSKSLPATFIATNSGENAYSDELAALLTGTDDFVAGVSQNPDGSRMISWPAADDGLSRTYKVWYTLDLMQDFQWLATVPNGTSYVDTAHVDEPVIYYKVTVE